MQDFNSNLNNFLIKQQLFDAPTSTTVAITAGGASAIFGNVKSTEKQNEENNRTSENISNLPQQIASAMIEQSTDLYLEPEKEKTVFEKIETHTTRKSIRNKKNPDNQNVNETTPVASTSATEAWVHKLIMNSDIDINDLIARSRKEPVDFTRSDVLGLISHLAVQQILQDSTLTESSTLSSNDNAVVGILHQVKVKPKRIPNIKKKVSNASAGSADGSSAKTSRTQLCNSSHDVVASVSGGYIKRKGRPKKSLTLFGANDFTKAKRVLCSIKNQHGKRKIMSMDVQDDYDDDSSEVSCIDFESKHEYKKRDSLYDVGMCQGLDKEDNIDVLPNANDPAYNCLGPFGTYVVCVKFSLIPNHLTKSI